MDDQKSLLNSPLSLEDLKRIEDTHLPPLDRHHLRLLAHCLACFKNMASGMQLGAFPDQKKRLNWCLNQPILANDNAFVSLLLDQFSSAALQLEKVADDLHITPLELTLQDLITESLKLKSL